MNKKSSYIKVLLGTILSTSILVGCGGSQGSAGSSTRVNEGTTQITEPTWSLGQFPTSSTYANYCEKPRTGTDPYENSPYPDKAGTQMHEKMWVRSFSHETYLWFDELPDNNPKNYTSVLDYFDTLKNDEDRFHFTDTYDNYKKESEGVQSGYGVKWRFISSTPPRVIRVAYTQDNSAAQQAGLMRGDTITQINGVDINSDNTDALNDGLFPSISGESHIITVTRQGVESPIELTLVSGDFAATPVQNAKVITHGVKKVGYVQYNAFTQVAQDGLISAFAKFKDEAIDELVLDMRYNGGGLVWQSAQVGYMVAGENNTLAAQENNKKVFSATLHNSKLSAQNSTIPFVNKGINWTTYEFTDTILPSSDLSKVYILSTSGTCSASESLINGLRGIDIDVVLIGGKTCGKPYGFNPEPNCGNVFYTVQFKGANAKDFGDYADGFTPVPADEVSPSNIGLDANVPGCEISDDFDHQLGDSNEAMLAAALHHVSTGSCPAQDTANSPSKIMAPMIFNSGEAITEPFNPMRNAAIYTTVKERK